MLAPSSSSSGADMPVILPAQLWLDSIAGLGPSPLRGWGYPHCIFARLA